MLKSLARKDRAEMVKDDKVVVTCEFCSSVYQFTRSAHPVFPAPSTFRGTPKMQTRAQRAARSRSRFS